MNLLSDNRFTVKTLLLDTLCDDVRTILLSPTATTLFALLVGAVLKNTLNNF